MGCLQGATATGITVAASVPMGTLQAMEQTYSATQENSCAVCGSSENAPQVAAPQPPLWDDTPAPSETGNVEYLLPVFYVAPVGTAVAMQETHHLDLFSFPDSLLEQSLDPYGISMGTTMFPSTALPQPIGRPTPSYQTITIRSCASSGSALTCASANKGLKWP